MTIKAKQPCLATKADHQEAIDALERLRDNDRKKSRVELLMLDRQIQMHKDPDRFGVVYSPECVERVLASLRKTKLWEGDSRYVGKTMKVTPYQEHYLIRPVYGWLRFNNVLGCFVRAVQECLCMVPRKWSKTSTVAALSIYHLLYDREQGAQVCFAATTVKQANITLNAASNMILLSDVHRKRCKVYKRDGVFVPRSFSRMFTISGEHQTADGLNPSLGVVDEYHQHANDNLVEKMITARGARTQPLLFYTTTAARNKYCPLYKQVRFSENLLNGVPGFETVAFHPMIFCAEEGDDIYDPEIWRKANPHLGHLVFEHTIEAEAVKARGDYIKEASFKRMHLNLFAEAASLKMLQNPDDWLACEDKSIKLEDLVDCECYAGLDLSMIHDLTSLVLNFLLPDGRHAIFCFNWAPEEGIDNKAEHDRVPYRLWANEGVMELTPGKTIDYSYVIARILWVQKHFNLKALLYDPWNSSYIERALVEHGVNAIVVRQNALYMSVPIRMTQRDIMNHNIAHNGDPLLHWQISNVEIEERQNGLVGLSKPPEGTESYKIDSVVAIVLSYYGYVKGMEDAWKTLSFTGFGDITEEAEDMKESEDSKIRIRKVDDHLPSQDFDTKDHVLYDREKDPQAPFMDTGNVLDINQGASEKTIEWTGFGF